jgi:GNAT superfamily N-acetyltransferase
MLLVTQRLAGRIERVESTLVAEFARAVARRVGDDNIAILPAGGGLAVFAGPGSPFSKFAGLGFAAVDPAALDHVEREFARRGAAVRIELSTLADPAIGGLLTTRGYRLRGFENVLGIPLTANPGILIVPGASVTVERTAPDDRLWLDTMVSGFLHPDVFDGPSADEPVPREALEEVFGDSVTVDGFVRYLAHADGAVAGAGSMRMSDGIAQLSGAATLPGYRRRGVQTTLLRHRLVEAAHAGCEVAIVTTQPGSTSQANAQRQGFELLYARAILVKGD